MSEYEWQLCQFMAQHQGLPKRVAKRLFKRAWTAVDGLKTIHMVAHLSASAWEEGRANT